MYGLIAKLTALPGKRDEFISIVSAATVDMPGCYSYVMAKDAADENTIWVTEVWDSEQSHDASLTLKTVLDAIVRAKPLIANFQKVASTKPVAGVREASAQVST